MALDLAGHALLLLAVASFGLVGVLLTQIVAAVLPGRALDKPPPATAPWPRVAVLMPAHDEAAGIVASLRTIVPQLRAGDRLIVVADNCGDDTARVAASAGAEVVERRDLSRRGKGYALDFGVRHLERSPPEVVIVCDADCELESGSLAGLAHEALCSLRPVQALYEMHAPPGAGLKSRIAAFAWVVRNHVRPLGCLRLGLPCQLMGTGMAFPWALIRDAPLATGHIVEDMQLGIDLAAAGASPMFFPQARVVSVFPGDASGVADQRARWEHGHLDVILKEVPRALWHAVVQRRFGLAAMALDLCVPPLAALVSLLVLQALAGVALFALGGTGGPLAVTLTALALLVVAMGLAWSRFARSVVSLADLARAPLYVLAKMPLYARFFKRGKREWVRARRDERE